jgi:phosphoribosylaminoimidazolecarboxamide formyltransferase/IMP cyclohydrolase
MNKSALLSVSDKTGLIEFAKGLVELGYRIISTGGTAAELTKAGIVNTQVADITGFAECLDGRVKTLHPNVHAGILANRSIADHMKQLGNLNIGTIDIVCVNLYPFEKTISNPKHKFDEAIENIDIGGPAMLSSAAKNCADVIVTCCPCQYESILDALRSNNVTAEFKQKLSSAAFDHMAYYRALNSKYMQTKTNAGFAREVALPYTLIDLPRYGENPDQPAAVYFDPMCSDPLSLKFAEKLNGKEMSFNNFSDAQAVINMLVDLGSHQPACVVVKHEMPAGVAYGKNCLDAYTRARDADPVSYFGGVIGFNRTLDAATAQLIIDTWTAGSFIEIVLAPDFDTKSIEVLTAKANLRILKLPALKDLNAVSGTDYKILNGVLLAQTRQELDTANYRVVTKAQPTKQQMADLIFAFAVSKHVRSNGVVLADGGQTIGIGGGPGRRDLSAQIATWHAEMRRPSVGAKGTVAASDAFFPKPDGPETLIKAGVTAIIQPGGSIRDNDTIALCDQYNVPMVFTGQRVFGHSSATSIPGKSVKK